MKPKAYFNWSSGKDSSLALYKSLMEYDIATLYTSINRETQRVSMHGVKVDLLKKQAESIGIPLTILSLTPTLSMEDYEKELLTSLNRFKKENINTAIFGDIFLEDLKNYRTEQLKKIEISAVFPIWKMSTENVIEELIDLGFKAVVTCIDNSVLDKSFVGRIVDKDFIKDLPTNVDVCGENGEFHTFVFDGPIFSKPIKFEIGEKVYKECEENNKTYGFWYCDLV